MSKNIQKDRFIEENQGLIHLYLQRQLHILPHSAEYDDLISVGTIALIKAANTFDESQKIQFSTYATICIRNEIGMYFRKTNKYKNEVSIYEPISIDNAGKPLLLDDILEDENANLEEKFIEKDMLISIINIVMNFLSSKERLAVLYYLANYNQHQTAAMLNLSQSAVAKYKKKYINRIGSILKTQTNYTGFFSITIAKENYIIDFSVEYIINFDYKVFLQKLTYDNSYSIIQKENRIIIELPIVPASYLCIIKLIQVIEEFNELY